MPNMPPKPCASPRCRNMSIIGGRCEEHKIEMKPWKSSEGKSASERGYGYKWQKDRKRALVRDNYLCQECLKSNRLTKASDVDHIISKALGGNDNLSNLQSLCNPCHKIKTIQERDR